MFLGHYNLRYWVASLIYQEGFSHFIQFIFMFIGTPSLRELMNIHKCSLYCMHNAHLWKPVLEPGFYEWISIFLLWNIILFGFFIFSIFFESLKSESTQMLRPQKGNTRVSFNLNLNFGLRMNAFLKFIFRQDILSPKIKSEILEVF